MASSPPLRLFSRLSIRQKIILMVVLTQLFAIVSLTIGLIGMYLSNASLSRVHSQSLLPLQHLRSSKNAIEKEMLVTATELSEGVGDFSAAPEKIRISREKLASSWNAYLEGSKTPRETAALEEAETAMERAGRSVELLEKAVISRDIMQIHDLIQSDFPYSLAPASAALDGLIELQISNAQELYAASQKEFERTLLLIVITLPVGLVIVLLLVRFMSRDLLAKIGSISRITHHLSTGNLTQRIALSGSDELAVAAREMNSSMEELQKMVGEIKSASQESISTAQELNAVSSAIRQRLEAGTADITQTHSQIMTLRSIVQTSAASARDTHGKIDEANRNLTEADGQISRMNDDIQTVAAMQQSLADELRELSSQAQEVKGVLDIIGDIADQTNLLALNAAIEAARAGEHGRGFAVVADEVRKLAERTQEGLSRINGTISTIVGAIVSTSHKMDRSTGSIRTVSHDSNAVRLAINTSSTLISVAAESVRLSNQNLVSLTQGMNLISERIDSLNTLALSNATSIRDISGVTLRLDHSTAGINEKLAKFRT